MGPTLAKKTVLLCAVWAHVLDANANVLAISPANARRLNISVPMNWR